jgi:hypothetical protein
VNEFKEAVRSAFAAGAVVGGLRAGMLVSAWIAAILAWLFVF